MGSALSEGVALNEHAPVPYEKAQTSELYASGP